MTRALRDSGVGWLGMTPDDWPIVPARAVFGERKQKSNAADVHLTPSQKYGVLPQADYMEITGNKVVLNLSGADNMRHVEPGDFVSHLRSFQGGLEFAGMQGKVSAAYTVLKPKLPLEPRFFKYLFKSDLYIQALQTTTDQLRDGQSIRYGQFTLIPLPYPALDEQRAIADYLDRETAQIDAFIAKNEELINLLIERRSAVASQAMYRGFQDVAVRHMVQLIQTGPFGSQLHAEDYVPGGHPLINPMHMIDGRAVPSSDVAISDDKADELRRHALRTDDLVVARRGELGRSALITPDQIGFLCGTGSMLIRPDSRRVVARYLQLAIGSERSRSTLREQSVGSTMENLNAGALSALRVPLPPIETQHEILHELDVANARIEAALTTARRSTDLARERRAALISAAVTGKIDVGVAG